jgi:hypothetical protein
MKINARDTHTRVMAKRITAPETRVDRDTGKKILLLSYIDQHSNQRHDPTTKDLFLYAAGSNEEGEVADGLDRLLDGHFNFIIHKNQADKAIGIDVIPARMYRSGVIPVSQQDVKTLLLQYDLGGAVCRVLKRPFNTAPQQTAAVIREIDKIVADGKPLHTGMRLGSVGTVVNTTDNTVEVRLRSAARTARGAEHATAEQMAEEADDS